MRKTGKIELLAPAKNLEGGKEAILHGADAVYIGAPKFSARAAAGNSLDDIRALVDFAHPYHANVYVALNTILRNEELEETERLIWELYRIGVDALIIQDMGITMLNLPPLPLHASTQADNRTLEKIQFLEQAGFSQVVLARELSLEEIRTISKSVSVPLEVFVHGALCVSYSGQCYLSEALCGRSANRGACAQFCRLPYKLVDSEGQTIQKDWHLLSMKDLDLSAHLEDLIDAGISSFKIEGRLKDISYVKNTVAYYRQGIDRILESKPGYYRTSSGISSYSFNPQPEKSFNRGFTTYFFKGRTEDICSVYSPKSIGEPIGKVKAVFDRFFTLPGTKNLNNGDGLCFLDDNKQLQGVRVNRVEGEKIFYPENGINIRKGTAVYRNYDHEFEKTLGKRSAERKVSAGIIIGETDTGFVIRMEDEDAFVAETEFPYTKEEARKEQEENIKNNLSKTGNTIFTINKVDIQFGNNWFIPASVLSEWRRRIIDKLLETRLAKYAGSNSYWQQTFHPYPERQLTYTGNVMNRKSKLFYLQHNAEIGQMAFEMQPQEDVPLMFTRHCIKYMLGWCPEKGIKQHVYKEPFFLEYNNTCLKLQFDCKRCEMKIVKAER